MHKKTYYKGTAGICLLILSLIIAAYGVHALDEGSRSTILTAQRISENILIDGHADEASWDSAREFITNVKDGSIGKVDLSIKSLYDDENIYFYLEWEDPTESVTKDRWTKSGDKWVSSENEDRLAFIWNIDGSIQGFDIAGCAMLCHGDRMHTNSPDEKGDVWHWKASRTNPQGFIDDWWMSDEIMPGESEESLEAAFHPDTGRNPYRRNARDSGEGPGYYEPHPLDEEDRLYLFEDELKNGEILGIDGDPSITFSPGYILDYPDQSRGDIQAKGVWSNGRWSLEFKRPLKTGHPDDVTFETDKIYRFGVALMDNAGGFEGYGKGHSFDLGARTLEFGGKGSKEVTELALVRDYIITSKAYVVRGETGLALSTISDALGVYNRIRDAVAETDPELFIKIRNNFVDSRRNPSFENIELLQGNVDLAILTFQGKRKPAEATFGLKVLVFWGKVQIYVFILLALFSLLAVVRMIRIVKRKEFRALGIFMLMIISPIFLEGTGRLGALLEIPLLQNLSFTTSEYVTLIWAASMFIALYIGRIGFNEIDKTLNSLSFYSRELEKKMKELKDSQDQLLRSERLASIGQLAASMAHELRNPLGVIKNISYYLKMNIKGKDPSVEKHLGLLDQELYASNKIITDLLDFSRGRPPTLSKNDLSRIVEEALHDIKPPKNVEINTYLASDLPPVMADKEQLKRVLNNLIINAFQAMPQGGILTLSAGRDEKNFHLDIEDTGQGIKKDDLPKVFEPLFSTKAKGIGIGLALSKQIIELHHGSISVTSEQGKGTKFHIILPITDGHKKI